MSNILDDFNKNLNDEFSKAGILGVDAAKSKRNFSPMNEKEEGEKNYKPFEFLKKKSSLPEILELVKNKKLTNVKIRQEIKKFLKDPEQINEFLQSILDNRTKKGENKEATGTGGGAGTFEPMLSLGDPKKVETKEATSSSSVGPYDAPGFEDVKMRGNHHKGRGRSFKKTQLPGGKFVQVKKKCKRFPYCNQGDIKALNIFENETLKSTIENMSKKYGLSEDVIKEFILKEVRINQNL